jgi:hypothetical protein
LKTKELVLTAILIALTIVQNYVLFSFPITLTYTILYFLTKKVTDKKLPFLAVLVFVIVKNIVMPARIPTILFDIIGLSLFISVCMIPKKIISYILIPVVIVVHTLLLDLSWIVLTINIFNLKELFILWGGAIASGFITYIYCPLSIVLIVIIDGIEYLTELKFDNETYEDSKDDEEQKRDI